MISISEWYHTGDDDIDEFIDRNRDVLTLAIAYYGEQAVRAAFRKRTGLLWSSAVIAAAVGRLGSDTVGFILADVIDPDEGRAKWNEFQNRIYDWHGLEEYQLLGIGIDLFPNPLALKDVVVETNFMVADYILSLDWKRTEDGLNLRDLVTSTVPNHPWNAEPGWRHEPGQERYRRRSQDLAWF